MTEWRTIADFPDYEVSDEGQVRRRVDRIDGRRKAGRVLTPTKHRLGYLIVGLYRSGGQRRTYLVHALVAVAFHGPRPTEAHEVAHSDGTRDNNCAENLRWALPAENQADRHRQDTALIGERHPSAKLTWAQVAEIRERLASGEAHRRLATAFRVSRGTISFIASGRHWKQEGGNVHS